MARKRAPPSPVTLANPEVTLEQTAVYWNGLQQATLVLYLEAKQDGKFVHLTPAEVASIRIITFDRRQGVDEEDVIPFNDDDPSLAFRGWSAQRRYRGYNFQASRKGEAKADPGEHFVFYCSAASDAREFLDVAFMITTLDGAIWRTNGWITRGGIREYSSALEWDTNIRVTPRAPLVYTSDEFLLDRTPLDEGASLAEDPAAAIFNDILTLSIKALDGRTVEVRSMSCEPAGMIHWINKYPTTQNPCFTGYAAPGETTIHWNDAVRHGGQPLPLMTRPEEGRGVIVLCGRNDIAPYADAPGGPVAVSLVDADGSPQSCHIGFIAGTRDEFEVT